MPEDSAGRSTPVIGDLLSLIRTERVATRADVAALTGWGRGAISGRLQALAAAGLIRSAGEPVATGGRPAVRFEFNARAGTVLAAEIGGAHVRVAVTDLAARVLADVRIEIEAGLGPEHVLAVVDEQFEVLLASLGAARADVFGAGLGLAAPVEFAAARPVNPPIMAGWHEFPVGAWVRDRWSVPALVDNDVNMMAVGEHAATWSEASELMCIEAGAGIGCGIVSGGRIHRGARGAAGDIGHIRVTGHDHVTCRCGNTGCLEAVAGGRALADALSRAGILAEGSRDVVAHVRAGRREAVTLVRDAGRLLGQVLAGAVNLLNPSVIVVGGDLAAAEEPLLAGIRETVYQRSLPLATQHLQIVPSRLAGRSAVIGAAVTAIEHTLSPRSVETILAGRLAAA